MCFTKINHQHHLFFPIERGNIIIEYRDPVIDKPSVIYYNEIENKQRFYDMYKLLPERYHDDFFITEMVISEPVPPHTDSQILTTINFYINTGDCSTIFYKFRDPNNIDYFKLSNQTTGAIFTKDNLDVLGSFVAMPADIYLLDVTVPHSIEHNNKLISSIKRTALCLQSFKYGYDAVLEMLKETNSI